MTQHSAVWLDKVLYHETTILSRLDELARQITEDYRDRQLTVVAVLHGSLFFAADLLRRIQLPLKLETISVASYHGGTSSSGTIRFNQVGLPVVEGRDVLLIDDILDSGRTLHTIRQRFVEECSPASVKLCALLSKRCQRAVELEADYAGFEIGDEFVIGYGLDYRGHYRNLPFIGTLTSDAIAGRTGFAGTPPV